MKPVGPWRPIDYGAGHIRHLADHAAQRGWKKLLMLTGRASFEKSGAVACLEGLRSVADVTTWSDFSTNPGADDLARGLRLVDDGQFDAVFGIGGGSVMDMAKLLVAFSGTTGRDEIEAAIRSQKVAERRHGLVLAPTTSGSGSEATHFAVVYIGNTKYSVAGASLRPDITVLDPSLAASGSPHQRATSGIDAVCQAIESLWSAGADAASRRNSRWALNLLLPAIRTFVSTPSAPAARAMCLGSHLAGRSIDTSKTTAPHALAYGITKRYGVSHGNAVAVSLPGFLDVHATATREQLQASVELGDHEHTMAAIARHLGASQEVEASDRFRELLSDIGLASRLRDMDVRLVDVPRLVADVNVERLSNNPVALTRDQLADILSTCW